MPFANIDRAVRCNRKLRRPTREGGVGWGAHYIQIVRFLGNGGSAGRSERDFAKTVELWQQDKRFTPRDCDGIIGKQTWDIMQQDMGIPSSQPGSTNETRINGVRVRFRHAINPDAVANLRKTLALVPWSQLVVIRKIDVVPPSFFGHGPTYAGGGSGVGYPRLSELCFDHLSRPNNFPHNLTLLHEIGHVLEDHFDCRRHLALEHRRVIDAIQIPANGKTHGPGEYYAIAYQKVIAGTATPQVRAAVFSSRAFNGVETSPP